MWNRHRGCQEHQHLLESKLSSWDLSHVRHSKGSESRDIRHAIEVLCLPGFSPCNTIPTQGEATHAWMGNQWPLLAAWEVAGWRPPTTLPRSRLEAQTYLTSRRIVYRTCAVGTKSGLGGRCSCLPSKSRSVTAQSSHHPTPLQRAPS